MHQNRAPVCVLTVVLVSQSHWQPPDVLKLRASGYPVLVSAMKVVIIGSGPSGLVTCKSLLEAASEEFPFDPVILEQESDIGGTFRYRSYQVGVFIKIVCQTQSKLNST